MIIWMVKDTNEHFRLRWNGEKIVAEAFNDRHWRWDNYDLGTDDIREFADGARDVLIVEIEDA
jgi:hypothetical protein